MVVAIQGLGMVVVVLWEAPALVDIQQPVEDKFRVAPPQMSYSCHNKT